MTGRTAYFHVGMPKTGTTAIQQSFAASRDVMRANGLLYPGKATDHADLTPIFHDKGPLHYYYANRRISEADAAAIGEAALAEVREDIREFDGDVILSTEYFFDISLPYVHKLRNFFVDLGFQFRVILYIRHPVSAAVSHANQDIKQGFRTLKEVVEAPRFHSNAIALDTFRQSLERDQIIVRDYEAVKDHDCVHDILEVCGYRGNPSEIQVLRSNVSLSMGGAILADAYTRLKSWDPDFPTRRTYMFKVGGPKFVLPEETIERVRQEGEKDVRWIQDWFGISLKEGKRSGVYSETLSDEAVLDLVRYLSTLKQPPR